MSSSKSLSKQAAVTIDKRDTRMRILDAAAKAFVTHGFSNARLSQIAKLAGVSRSTLYESFPGKEQLLIAINHLVIEESLSLARETLLEAPNATEAVRRWLRSGIQLNARYRNLLKIMHSDEVQPELLLDRDATLSAIQDAQKWLRQILRKGIQDGEFREDIPVGRIAHTLQNMHYLLTRQAVADHPLFDFGVDGGEATVDLLIRGLQIPPLIQKAETGAKRKKKT